MPRKRAAGGGRKPKGDFSDLRTPLSIRMPVDMRQKLEESAALRPRKGGWSLTQEMLFRLQGSIDHEREAKRDPATRALCYLLSELVSLVSASTIPDSRPSAWRADPFAFRTVKLAFMQVLDALEPKGNLQRRRQFFDFTSPWSHMSQFRIGGDTPEETASSATSIILMSLERDRDAETGSSRSSSLPLATISPTRLQKNYEFGMKDASRELLSTKGKKR